ncbi:hypothetical protein DP49_4652 [Burkholderia pseudomallei]|nr:hypothetical protein DP49_4652 [Burkholderia pseudomallei]
MFAIYFPVSAVFRLAEVGKFSIKLNIALSDFMALLSGFRSEGYIVNSVGTVNLIIYLSVREDAVLRTLVNTISVISTDALPDV